LAIWIASNARSSAFRFSKKYFWFSEEPVSVSSLSHYLRGEKAEIAHPTAAWSSQTGKGLLYFVKHADDKKTPAGVLNLVRSDTNNVMTGLPVLMTAAG
jgi:hypothetical protein